MRDRPTHRLLIGMKSHHRAGLCFSFHLAVRRSLASEYRIFDCYGFGDLAILAFERSTGHPAIFIMFFCLSWNLAGRNLPRHAPSQGLRTQS